MTNNQFKLLVKLIRGNSESPATKAAHLVLVEGVKQGKAAKITGASPSNVHDALVRYSHVHQQILEAYELNVDSGNCNYLPRGVALSDEERIPASATQRAKVMKIELKVDWHPSGRRTLKERSEGARMWKDCLSPAGLFANQDPQDFYAKVQQYIDTLLANNALVEFNDSTTKPASSMGMEIKTRQLVLTLQNLDFDKLSQHPEPLVVDTISTLLQANYPNVYNEEVSWLAYREQIQVAHARKVYGSASQAQIALQWGRSALNGTLVVRFDRTYGLSIQE
ncbi:hypothetical protein [Pseudomonas sp. BF-RE-29]|uniref:hypothetical protein n=1 Tax=Pseudomonas sp. BF-RE-29 TaxID=2832378 RepID=UPI001CBFEEC7|nr:hypothetical protein [Pseudomonas sp. BF-RE-29]